jgi:hypothetical protein
MFLTASGNYIREKANPMSDDSLRQAGAIEIEITPAMERAGRESLLDAFQEDGLSQRTPGLSQGAAGVFRAMMQAYSSGSPARN